MKSCMLYIYSYIGSLCGIEFWKIASFCGVADEVTNGFVL